MKQDSTKSPSLTQPVDIEPLLCLGKTFAIFCNQLTPFIFADMQISIFDPTQ